MLRPTPVCEQPVASPRHVSPSKVSCDASIFTNRVITSSSRFRTAASDQRKCLHRDTELFGQEPGDVLQVTLGSRTGGLDLFDGAEDRAKDADQLVFGGFRFCGEAMRPATANVLDQQVFFPPNFIMDFIRIGERRQRPARICPMRVSIEEKTVSSRSFRSVMT